ncbi:MAG: lipoprotein insertase outer membrane protein LolB [Nitrococcus sp.]|nr:lipoprotein insertase outer membrane protein LolB [Nitrococcus sp.]
MRRLLGICLSAGLVLAGCAVQPPVPEQARLTAFASHQAQVRQLSSWSLAGRAAIRTAREGGSVAVHWQQLNERYRIDLIAPFGAGSVRLTGDARSVRLQTSRGESVVAASARNLLRRYMGYDVPVAALRYWLLGIPAPGPVARQRLDRYGRLAVLAQQGWRVEFQDYGRFSGVELPTALVLERGRMEVKLVIRDWDLSA